METSVRVDGKQAWNGEGWEGSGIRSSENGIKVKVRMGNREVMDMK